MNGSSRVNALIGKVTRNEQEKSSLFLTKDDRASGIAEKRRSSKAAPLLDGLDRLSKRERETLEQEVRDANNELTQGEIDEVKMELAARLGRRIKLTQDVVAGKGLQVTTEFSPVRSHNLEGLFKALEEQAKRKRRALPDEELEVMLHDIEPGTIAHKALFKWPVFSDHSEPFITPIHCEINERIARTSGDKSAVKRKRDETDLLCGGHGSFIARPLLTKGQRMAGDARRWDEDDKDDDEADRDTIPFVSLNNLPSAFETQNRIINSHFDRQHINALSIIEGIEDHLGGILVKTFVTRAFIVFLFEWDNALSFMFFMAFEIAIDLPPNFLDKSTMTLYRQDMLAYYDDNGESDDSLDRDPYEEDDDDDAPVEIEEFVKPSKTTIHTTTTRSRKKESKQRKKVNNRSGDMYAETVRKDPEVKNIRRRVQHSFISYLNSGYMKRD